jgi:hypothetical protein
MKKNLSGIVLTAEILIVILFHAFKIRQNENIQAENAIVRISKGAMSIPKSVIIFKSKPEYFFVRILK